MKTPLEVDSNEPEKEDNEDFTNLRRCSNEISNSAMGSFNDLESRLSKSSSDDEDDVSRKRTMKRIKRFSNSDTDEEKSLNEDISGAVKKSELPKSKVLDSVSDSSLPKNISCRSRIKINGNISNSDESERELEPLNIRSSFQDTDSESDLNVSKREPHKSQTDNASTEKTENGPSNKSKFQSSESQSDTNMSNGKTYTSRLHSNDNLSDSSNSGSEKAVKSKEQQLRMKNKRNKLRDKFKNLLATRGKETSPMATEDKTGDDSDSSHSSDEDAASIEKIKQKIKERTSFKPSICDPDTSEEESVQQKPTYKQKKERKMTKLTSPKPQRMSAKQAMENMQKIKSESNRMLREKEVSLPYHRPKALSLKDIMSRRKLATSADGKSLPIKMNEEQLKQFAQMLEERQKEMMELCKSESEEETNEKLVTAIQDTPANEVNETHPDNTTSNEDTKNINNISDTDNNVDENSVNEDKHVEVNMADGIDPDQLSKDQDSKTSMQLVYNESASSVADETLTADAEVPVIAIAETEISPNNFEKKTETLTENSGCVENQEDSSKPNTEVDSQLISLHFDTENTIDEDLAEQTKNTTSIDKTDEIPIKANDLTNIDSNINDQDVEKTTDTEIMEADNDNEFSDDDMNMADIDNIIENAEIIKDIEDKVNSQFLVRDRPLNLNPKLTGAPGMVIDLDTEDAAPRKSGVELLKERFTYFAKLKTPDEIERERERKLKPGTQLKKLKQELEEKMNEQRSLEWAKRLEEERQHQEELKVLRGEESDEDDIDKIEAAIEANEDGKEESENSESEAEEEPIENDIEIKDKPRIKNDMLDEEAQESDCGEEGIDGKENDVDNKNDEDEDDGDETDDENNDDGEEDDSESDESSESEEEQITTKKGRILKAFVDSDEEDSLKTNEPVLEIKDIKGRSESKSSSSVVGLVASQILSQDEELQLAQRHKTNSEDLFTSQESALLASEAKEKTKDIEESDEAFTQTFSILESSKMSTAELSLNSSGKLSVVCNTQSLEINNLDEVSGMCPVTDSQNNLPLPSQIPTTQLSQSQPIGEDILALCTGKFYDNQFVSQTEENQVPLGDSQKYDAFDTFKSQDSQNEAHNAPALCNSTDIAKDIEAVATEPKEKETDFIELNTNKEKETLRGDDNLKSILDELAGPEFDCPKPNKYFPESSDTLKDTGHESLIKKKFIIESDDETNENAVADSKKRKKLKKKKPEKRALQISDDEEELSELEEVEEYETDIEEENPERLVDYDSEENEIELKPQNPKKKRKMAEFFENEAELTSEDEWAGSGDEDEAGLDRMEREEGDEETFHQGKLQQELGQIHMRDVLDQDKREVRLIQELLFEDGDLGEGGRQRKFRWQNINGEEETGTVPDELADTQEEEFESEEQWRKQRHERETFLRQMQNQGEPEESLNVSVNRTTIIKANLLSKTMSSLLMEVNTNTENTESPVVEQKTAKDIPSPKKPFALLQHSYQGSMLSRGRGALARLAALATPLAADDDAKVATLGPTNRRNFVFATLTPEQKEPKVSKRKAESNPSTPKLVKKMRNDDKQNTSKNSLLNHFKL